MLSSFGGVSEAIYRMLDGLAVGPEDVKAMTTAYEAVLVELGLTDRADPITEVVARKIIAYCTPDRCDAEGLRNKVLQDLRDLPAKPPRGDGTDKAS